MRSGPPKILSGREPGRGQDVRLPGHSQQGEELQLGEGVRGRPLQKNRDVRARAQGKLINRYSFVNVAHNTFQTAPMESAQALIDSVMKSPHKNVLLSFLSFAIGVIFMFGLCFGRVTKRLRTEIKNK